MTNDLGTHFLYPSTLFASPRPYVVTTILGSCVAVCLFDPISKVGGINHYILPLWNGEGLTSPRYGNIAIKKLIDKMLSMGCQKPHLVAKVFGGGERLVGQPATFQIGRRNVEQALNLLEEERIEVLKQHVGGNVARHLKFHTATGDVFLKKTVMNREASS